MKPIQVYLEEEQIKELKMKALDEGTTLSDVVRDLLFSKTPKPSVEPLAEPLAKPLAEPLAEIKKKISKTADSYNIKLCKHHSALGLCKYGCK